MKIIGIAISNSSLTHVVNIANRWPRISNPSVLFVLYLILIHNIIGSEKYNVYSNQFLWVGNKVNKFIYFALMLFCLL